MLSTVQQRIYTEVRHDTNQQQATKWTDTMERQIVHTICSGWKEIDYLDCEPMRHTTRSALVRRAVDDKSHRWHLLYEKQIPTMSVERIRFTQYLYEMGEYES